MTEHRLMDTEPWQLWLDDGPPDSMLGDGTRLSEDCICARLRRPFAPDEYRELDEWIDARGHGFEVIVAWNLERAGHTVLRHVAIPWAHGHTHPDLVVVDGPLVDANGGAPVVVECKANKNAEVKPENVRQVRRQMYMAQKATEFTMMVNNPDGWSWTTAPVDLSDPRVRWVLCVINPERWQVPSGSSFLDVEMTPDYLEQIIAEEQVMDEYAPIAHTLDVHWESDWPPCTCSKCWPKPQVPLPSKIHDLAHAYDLLRDAESDAKREKESVRDDILTVAKAEMRRLRVYEEAEWPQMVGGDYTVTVTKKKPTKKNPGEPSFQVTVTNTPGRELRQL